MVMLSEDAEFCGDVNGWIRKKSMSVVLGFFVVVSVVFFGYSHPGEGKAIILLPFASYHHLSDNCPDSY